MGITGRYYLAYFETRLKLERSSFIRGVCVGGGGRGGGGGALQKLCHDQCLTKHATNCSGQGSPTVLVISGLPILELPYVGVYDTGGYFRGVLRKGDPTLWGSILGVPLD